MFALKRPFFLVTEIMSSQQVVISESCAAQLTEIKLDIEMNSDVILHVIARIRSVSTVITLKRELS